MTKQMADREYFIFEDRREKVKRIIDAMNKPMEPGELDIPITVNLVPCVLHRVDPLKFIDPDCPQARRIKADQKALRGETEARLRSKAYRQGSPTLFERVTKSGRAAPDFGK